jgi:homoserine kinase type II
MKLDEFAAGSEIERILANYDLGELLDFDRDERGYNNTSYAITTRRNKTVQQYFFRRYKSGIQEEEIIFEHDIVNHLLSKKFAPIARVFRTKGGNTYCIQFDEGDQKRQIFYAIFDFIPGEDKYTWVENECSNLELQRSAEILAQYHHAVADLQPGGHRFEPKIFELIPQIGENILSSLNQLKGTAFDAYLQDHIDDILANLSFAKEYLKSNIFSDCPQIVIHCDYHPGNLKFDGEQVVGLFDFDWSKIDYRCFDVALAIWYFSSIWKGEFDGTLIQDKVQVFLNSYQTTLSALPDLVPLNETELRHLPIMIGMANLYILNWTIPDYYSKDVDPEEYLIYLKHGVNFIRWFADPDRNFLHVLFKS